MNANTDSKKLQSGSRDPETSNGSTVSGASTELTCAVAIQPSFQKLNLNDQDGLLAKLYDDERSMKLEFASLVTATCYSVQECQ